MNNQIGGSTDWTQTDFGNGILTPGPSSHGTPGDPNSFYRKGTSVSTGTNHNSSSSNINLSASEGFDKKSISAYNFDEFNAPVPVWSLDDERAQNLPVESQALINCMPLQSIQAFSYESNLLILNGKHGSVVITGTLKSTEVGSAMNVYRDTVYHVTKGIFCTGFLLKWPNKSQNIGRQTRRYFILKDAELKYYRSIPRTWAEMTTMEVSIVIINRYLRRR